MGVSPLGSNSHRTKREIQIYPPDGRPARVTLPPNPDPSKFSILKHRVVGTYIVVAIKYHSCTNYGGEKVLVFKDLAHAEVYKLEYIDPHFSESELHPSPIARFEPTDWGFSTAVNLCCMLYNRDIR